MTEGDSTRNDKIFPKSFFWGASTAAHQVEGGNVNQWSDWELANARELAQTAEQRLGWLPSWGDIKAQAKTPENYVSGRGVDHYRLYKEDFDILQQLNMNAFRFGIEWSRIEPEEGVWDEAAIAHYRSYIQELQRRHIEPFANLWHWTMPSWFADKGGFKNKTNLHYFERFVQKIADELSEDLTYIITLNEPNVYTSFGYVTGEWVPEQRNIIAAARVYSNLVRAHKRAYKILKDHKPELQIGVAAQLSNMKAKRPRNIFDQIVTKMMRYGWNWWFLGRVRNQQDYVGLNHYFTDYCTGFFRQANPKKPVSDLGWYMEPEGLHLLLLQVWARYKKPIIILENGLADGNDKNRRWWLEKTIEAMQHALNDGVDIRGYLHWSLLDNFEWKYGWWPKFGLVEVDRENGMQRTIRPSAEWFAKRIGEISHR